MHYLDSYSVKSRERALQVPQVPEEMVDNVLAEAHAMLEVSNHQELKTSLSHFIDRIEVKDRELTIYYSVAPSQNVAYNIRRRGGSNLLNYTTKESIKLVSILFQHMTFLPWSTGNEFEFTMVELRGLEPLTSSVQRRRSPS